MLIHHSGNYTYRQSIFQPFYIVVSAETILICIIKNMYYKDFPYLRSHSNAMDYSNFYNIDFICLLF